MLGRINWIWRARAGRGDLVEEMEAHRAMIQARLEAGGMSAADAAMESRRRMGNLTLAREDARSVWMAPWIDSIRQDIGYATRMLRHAPAFTGAMILVMALGIGATTAVFSLVDGLVLKSLPVRAPEQLFYVSTPSYSYPVFTEIRARGASVGDVMRMVLRQGMILPLVGMSLGLCGAFLLTRVFERLLFGVTATDPITFAAVAMLLLNVTLVACYLPARKASKVDPVVVLRAL